MASQDSLDMSWPWYAALYCRELGLCNTSEGGEGWGANNHDPGRVKDIARYYLEHRGHSRVGREMLLCCLYDSSRAKLRRSPLSPEEDQVLIEATRVAMSNVYDRDVVGWYWEEVPDPQGECPLLLWIKEHFPGWTPPPSIWSTFQ
jgi:hypothetical protein